MNTSNTYIKNLAVAILILAAMVMSACEDNATGVREASGPPQLDRVSLVTKDSTTTTGQRGVQYVIWGDNLAATRSVTFSGVEASINPALATDQNIIVTVPLDAPYVNASDSLVVTNPKGSASLPFHIIQPPPVIESFSPLAASTGDIITITGTIFDDVESVFFGDTKAEIVSSSPTEIQVEVPAGVVQTNITVITPGGEVTSQQLFGFLTLIYADALFSSHGSWTGQAYGANYDYQNTEQVSSGTHAIKIELTGGYGALQLAAYGEEPVDVSNATALKFALYAADGISQLKITMNNKYVDANQENITTTPGEYKTFIIPFSALGDIQQITEIVIQGTGTIGTFYVDDLGVI